MSTLAILGASGHGKVLADTALLTGWANIVFYDDAWPNTPSDFRWPVLGSTQDLVNAMTTHDGIIVGIGNNRVRAEKTNMLAKKGARLSNLIHPAAHISPFSKLGPGSFVGAGAVVQVDAKIGQAAIINSHAVVEHDCVIGDSVHISPSAVLGGGVSIGDGTWVGIGAVVKHLVQIGCYAVVGAGATVVSDVDDNTIVAGTPAKPLRS